MNLEFQSQFTIFHFHQTRKDKEEKRNKVCRLIVFINLLDEEAFVVFRGFIHLSHGSLAAAWVT